MKTKTPVVLLLLLLLVVLFSGWSASAAGPKNEPPAPVNDVAGPNEPPPSHIAPGPPAPLAPCSHQPSAVLYDNGPFVNSPGTGSGGADESRLQDSTLAMGTYGFGHAVSTGYTVADDFTVTGAAGWTITDFVFYAYQTGSTTATTFTEVRYQIWNGPPNVTGSAVVFGNLTTNRLTSSVWSNAYRVLLSAPGGNTRPIMANTASCGTHLNAGTYWVEWQAAGSLASGPWAPPITINGQSTTGNALQNTGTWAAATDVGPQGFPFVINGTAGSVASAIYDHHTAADSCGGGEAGGDGVLEPGETVALTVYLHNDGTQALTGVSATLTSTTPGMTILSGTATYGDMAVGAITGPAAPFQFIVPAGASCGQALDFSLSIQSGQGVFSDTFSDHVGNVSAAGGTLLDEAFEGTFPPSGWTTTAVTPTTNFWTRNDYWGATNNTGGSGFCADADSDGSGGDFGAWDTILYAPAFTVPAGATACTLSYKSNFQDYVGAGEAWQDISTDGGTTWTNLYYTSVDEPSTGTTHTADLLPYVGQSVILRWHYSDNGDGYAWYWRIDDVSVTYAAPASCTMTACFTGPAYDLSFTDDSGNSQLCVSSETGDYTFSLFSSPPVVYTGTSTISADLLGRVVITGNGPAMSATYSPIQHTASAFYKPTPIKRTAPMTRGSVLLLPAPRQNPSIQLRDSNTLDSPPCGGGGPDLTSTTPSSGLPTRR